MNRVIIYLVLMIIVKQLSAQNFDNLMKNKQLDCSDISYNSALLFQNYIEENKIDSAKSIILYWESKCGMREPIFRAKILLALKEGNYNDTLITESILAYIFNYQKRNEMAKYSDYSIYDYYKPDFGFIPPDQEFDNYTKRLASKIIKKYQPDQIEYLLCEFYSSNCDTIFTKIQSENYSQNNFYKNYRKVIDKYNSLPEGHYSWLTGLWVPTGNIMKLGIHPDLGFQLGVKHKRMNYDLAMSFKFINSQNNYNAKRKGKDSIEITNHFFGAYIGLEFGYDLYSRKSNEIQLLSGIAFDGFDALIENKDKNIKPASTGTYNFNFGVEYRFYINNSTYIGIRMKYNIVDYSLNKVIDFTGNPITMYIIIGNVTNILKSDNLKKLKYNWRK